MSLSLITIKSIAALGILLITWVAAYRPLRQHRATKTNNDFIYGEALAGGIFLGTALLHMLAESSEHFIALHYHYPIAFLIAGVGFLVLLMLEHFVHELQHARTQNLNLIALISTLMLSLHSFVAGTAVGITSEWTAIVTVLFAIIIHKGAASFSLAIQLSQSALSKRYIYAVFLLFSLTTPVGLLLGEQTRNAIAYADWLPPACNALAAGTFLYIGTLHGFNRAILIRRCCNLREFCAVIFGFGCMAIVAWYT